MRVSGKTSRSDGIGTAAKEGHSQCGNEGGTGGKATQDGTGGIGTERRPATSRSPVPAEDQAAQDEMYLLEKAAPVTSAGNDAWKPWYQAPNLL